MRYFLVAVALFASAAQAQNMSQMGNRNNGIPVHLLVIPQAWWTDQGNQEIACYHYDNGPYRDRLIEWCLAKVRGAK
jgi:hypothetical protein